MPERPLVAVLMGTYNGEAFVERALDALRAQDYPNLRIVVRDDGSTDGTASLCAKAALAEPRIDFRSNAANMGWLETYRNLVLESDAPFVAFAFHDDVIEPTYVSRLVERLEENPRAVVSYSDMRMYYPGNETIVRHTVQSGVRSGMRRAWNVLLHRNDWWVPFRGVVRADAARLCASELVPSAAGDVSCDWYWMLLLASLGEMERVPEVLYTKHLRKAGVTLTWRTSPFKHAQRRASAVRAIRKMPIGAIEKGLLVLSVGLSLMQIVVDGIRRRLPRRTVRSVAAPA
ncbi:MAG: glycosyltransferase [Armatimonadota bacterium]